MPRSAHLAQLTGAARASRAARLERALARHARLQDLILAFSGDGSPAGELKIPFAALCEGLPALFEARSAAVWFHDRQRRELVFEAGAGRAPGETESRLSIEETGLAVVRALRAGGPEIVRERTGATLFVPLRGRQRALGVLVVGGLSGREQDEEAETISLAGELARQLSVAIENRLLFEHVIRQARQEAARLAHSQKLAALGQFVAGIAHELNNPLQSVLGHLELLRRDRKLPRTLIPPVSLIHREADRAASIVNRLLIFAGTRRAARRRINANAALARAVRLRTRSCRDAGIRIVRRLDSRVPPTMGDALLLQQALLNILLNAEQAIVDQAGRRGSAPAPDSAAVIEVRTRAQRGRVIIEIRDTGPGIAPDALPRIFEPFFTTKEVGQGTGLGLALTYGIIQEHGGTIAARTPREGGTVFRVELPVDPRPQAPGPKPQAPRPKPHD